MTDALILSGGVAKGAFTAGVLSVLLGPEGKRAANVDVHSIVATSSGALNGAFAASLLHAGTEDENIARLAPLWIEDASFGRVFEPTFAGLLGLRGVSGEDKVRHILRTSITAAPKSRTIELRLVAASLKGNVEIVGGAPATTFERVFLFDAGTFADPHELEALFDAVAASAAFPGAFLPVPMEIDGEVIPCIDGGAVNNTPLGYALEHPFGIDRVFVVSPHPRVAVELPSDVRGAGLMSHLAEMLVEERLFRDLREAYLMNETLARLEQVLPDPGQRERVLESLGWSGRKPITIVELRPPSALPGGMFDGFFSRALRERYVVSGETTARAWLEG